MKCLEMNDWLFKTDMGLYYPKLFADPEILIDPTNININDSLQIKKLMTRNNLNIIKRYLMDKISKIIINIKMDNISYQFEKIYPLVKKILIYIDYNPDMLNKAIKDKQLNFFLKKVYQKISQLEINE